MLPVVTIKTWLNNDEKKTRCKRTKISTTSSANLLYSIFARVKRLHRPVAGKIVSNRRYHDMQGSVTGHPNMIRLLLLTELHVNFVLISIYYPAVIFKNFIETDSVQLTVSKFQESQHNLCFQIGSQFETLKANYEKAEKKEVRSINRKARDLFKQYANDSSW